LKKVKELIDLMVEKDLVEVEIVDGDSKIHLKGRMQQCQSQLLPDADDVPRISTGFCSCRCTSRSACRR
jgi:hypothetical protein